MRVQRFLAVRIAIAPEGFERNSGQIRSSMLVPKGTRCKKTPEIRLLRPGITMPCRGSATRRAGRTAARFGSPLTARTARHPVGARRAHPQATAQLPEAGGRRSAGETRSAARWFLQFQSADVKTPGSLINNYLILRNVL